MTHLIKTMCSRLERRRAYNTTLAELRSLPLDVKLDLDIAGIEDRVAHKSVYGA